MLLADASAATAASDATAGASATRERAKRLYFSLYDAPHSHLDEARAYVADQVAAVQAMPADLPSTLAALPAWVQERTEAVGAQYRDYLAARKNGAPRR